MALRSGFWNALPDANGDPFPKYNGDDFDKIGSLIIENGVIKNGDALSVSVGANNGSSYSLIVKAGTGFINGKWFDNSSDDSTTLVNIPSPTENNKRYDIVVVRRCNNIMGDNNRSCILKVIQGTQTTGTPIEPEISENELEYDICLARVYTTKVNGALSVSIQDRRTFINGYWGKDFNDHMSAYDSKFNTTIEELQQRADNWIDNTSLTQGIVYKNTVTLDEATNNVEIGIASYQYGVDKIEIYTNGEKEYEGADYTLNADGTVTFTDTKAVGVEIHFEVTKYVDGTTDVNNAYVEIEKTNQRVLALENISNEYNYVCNGVDDNVKISAIVKNFYNVNDYASLKLNIIGTIGMAAPVTGGGTSANPYGWFDFTKQMTTDRTITIDFSNCSAITPIIDAGTYNVIFIGDTMDIIKANISVSNTTNTTIRIFNSLAGRINADRCRFWITGYKDSLIAQSGTFTNCRGSVANIINNSYCFLPSNNGLIRVIGGEYYAFTGDSTKQSAVVGQSDANAVSILYGVNAPTVSRSGFYQTNSILQWTGGGILNCTDLISTLPLIVVSGISNIRGTIEKNKPNLL